MASTRFRRWTAWAATGWALLALIVGVDARIGASGLPSPPFALSSAAGVVVVNDVTSEARRAGVEPLDRLRAVDGRAISVWQRDGGQLGLVAGEANRYALTHPDGQSYEVELAPLPAGPRPFRLERFVFWAVPIIGLFYLVIGAGLRRLRPDSREAWVFLLFTNFAAALLFLAGTSGPVAVALIGVTVPWVGATGFHFFTTYPIEPAWMLRVRGARILPYGIAALLSLAAAATPLVPEAAPVIEATVAFFTVAATLGGIGTVLSERLLYRGHSAGLRADVMLLGAIVSYVPVTVLLTWHVVRGTTFPWLTGMLGFFAFPVGVGYGILRRDLMDLRLVAKSSAAYGAVTLAITGLFALGITLADALVRRFDMDEGSPMISIAFLFFAILGFNPLRVRVQAFVDRVFDRDRAAYRRAVREISEAMVSMLSAKEIVDRILVAVTDTMGVERAMVLLIDESGDDLRVQATRGDWDEGDELFSFSPDHPVCRALWMERRQLAREDFDEEPDPEAREQCRDVFDSLDVELLVPVLFGVDLLGVIAVGRKLTGERLGPDERQLLRTLANQSAIAIENARAFDEIAQLNRTLEARVEDRTRELRETQAQLVQSEKMRSLGQLVAGVAHELNNPIGFVHANLALMEEYVERLMAPDTAPEKRARAREVIEKLLQRSGEGTERVKQIVQDLRTFSRTDEADVQEADLNAELDLTLSLMEPRLKGGVEIIRDYEPLPKIRCITGQLNQVFINVLMNACDAFDGPGSICIRTRAEGDGVHLSFEDDGPGMSEEIRGRIFEPFFTTKPVGQGTGLGLPISYGMVQRHGGTMEVESEEGRGTTFHVRLPTDPPESLVREGGAE
jgi:signal transduction histidine kinase